MMKRILLAALAAAVIIAPLCLAQDAAKPGGGLKKRVAVMDFEDKTGHGSWHIGSGMADMLTTSLVKSGKFIVIERQQLENIMKEQSLGMTGAVTAQSAAQVGKLLGVELMVTGSVNEFGEKSTSVGGSVSRGLLGGALRGASIDKKTARVGLDVRLVNTSTGEIVAAEGIAEEETKTGGSLATNDFDFSTGADFDNTLAGKATRKAVIKCVEMITAAMDKIPWAGKIIKLNVDKTVFIKPGAGGGVKVGDVFTVYAKGEEIIDPDTGVSMGAEETKSGSIEIIEAKDAMAKAKVLSGSGFKVGDSVKDQ